MGENVLQGQVKSFKKGTDRSLKDMASPTLFNRPDIMSTVYTAAPVEGCGVRKGDRLEADHDRLPVTAMAAKERPW